MTEQNRDVRKRANTYFFSKVVFNLILIVIGACVITGFLRRIQHRTALYKQQQNSEKALSEALSALETNQAAAVDLAAIFHDSNQDMLNDLYKLMSSGLFSSMAGTDAEERSYVMQDMVERSGVDYLYIMGQDGRVLMSPYAELQGSSLIERGLLSKDNVAQLLQGTVREDGSISPVMENNHYGRFYFYSLPGSYEGYPYVLVLGTNAAVLDLQIESLKDVSVVLSRAPVGNGGFMFAVNGQNDTFLYFRNDTVDLTGQNALEAGLSRDALRDGYAGLQTINGVQYHCVSRTFGNSTFICAVAETAQIYTNDRYVLFWSITGFIVVMFLCLAYAVIVRNDFVRNAVETEQKIFRRGTRSDLIFDISIFKKVFPLMTAGVIMIFCISFYAQTLLEISESIEDSVVALDEVTSRYEESARNRETIKTYYNNRFLSKAKLLAYLIEEDPSVLNEETDRFYSILDEDGNRSFLTDDEGNLLRSVSRSKKLLQLCEENDIDSIYIFDEDGRTIATSTENWFFTVSHNEEDQSYPFQQILDGRTDYLIQDSMMSDVGIESQYFGVVFHYYTALDADGNTVYLSHFDNEAAKGTIEVPENGGRPTYERVTEHRSLFQIGMNEDLSARVLASTEIGSILSSDMLSGGFMVLFDNSPDHICLYSPVEASIGKTASEMGVSDRAFSGTDYYGFMRVNGREYFQYFRFRDDYFIGTAIPRSEMYTSRMIIALLTALTSLILILFLSGTVTLTTREEEELYATMSEEQAEKGLDSAIFNIILPSGRRSSTVKAAARWDNRHIPWGERSPEQKLLVLISAVAGLLILYVIITLFTTMRILDDSGSVIRYIASGNWDRGLNIFALSACAIVMIGFAVMIALFRIPVMLISALLGARGETISHLLLSVLKYGGTLGAFFYCLHLVGMDSRNLLASAGVLSLVIGLGAQSLIKDILAGIFIVFEGEFRVGDIVTISGTRGTVMDIGLRTTKILSPDGNIKIYNNSEISGILNMTKEASIAAATISIEYGQDIDYVEAVLKKELPLLRDENPAILDGPDYLGISNLGESGVDILIIAKCNEQDIKGVNRYLNKALLKIFYRNQINVPFPNITVSQLDMTGRKTIDDLMEAAREQKNS